MSINDKKIRLTKGKGKELSLRMYNGVFCRFIRRNIIRRSYGCFSDNNVYYGRNDYIGNYKARILQQTRKTFVCIPDWTVNSRSISITYWT